jgi:hypothetical protein
MQIPKQQIMNMLRDSNEPGDTNKANEAERELPEQVDTENGEHQSLLQRYGVDPQLLISKFGGNLGL